MSEINLEQIKTAVSEMQDDCNEIDTHWNDDALAEAIGDEETADEFRLAMSDLSYVVDRFFDDLTEWRHQEALDCFDALMSTEDMAEATGGMFFWSEDESDYLPAEKYAWRWGEQESEEKLARKTKKDLIEIFRYCIWVFYQYENIKYRYSMLKGTIDIVKGINAPYLEAVKEIATKDFEEIGELEFQQLVWKLPLEAWLF